MVFEEPKAEFVEIDVNNNIVASGCTVGEQGGGGSCSYDRPGDCPNDISQGKF